jgi:hypothetical protein
LPLPIAEKVLPFRAAHEAATAPSSPIGSPLAEGGVPAADGLDGPAASLPIPHDEQRIAAAWRQLADAELRGDPERILRACEDAFVHEVATLRARPTLPAREAAGPQG